MSGIPLEPVTRHADLQGAVPPYGPGASTTAPKARSAPWPVGDWGLMACEAVAVLALLATLVSFADAGDGGGGPAVLSASGLRDAYAACARFLDGQGPSAAGGREDITAWHWARLADGRFRVRGHSDARSPVGEPHRTYYQCDLVQLRPGRWSLDRVAVTTQEPGPILRPTSSPRASLGTP